MAREGVRVRVSRKTHEAVTLWARQHELSIQSVYDALLEALMNRPDLVKEILATTTRPVRRQSKAAISIEVRGAIALFRSAGMEPAQIGAMQLGDIIKNGVGFVLMARPSGRRKAFKVEMSKDLLDAVGTLARNARRTEEVSALGSADIVLIDESGNPWPASRIGYAARSGALRSQSQSADESPDESPSS